MSARDQAPAAALLPLTASTQAARADAATPLQLLRMIDGWLSISGHEEDHEWRRCIGATLAAYGSEAPTVKASDAAHLFSEIAETLTGLDELLCDVLNGKDHLWAPAFSTLRHAGWLADAACKAHGETPFRGDAAAWLLSPRAGRAVEAAEHVTRQPGASA